MYSVSRQSSTCDQKSVAPHTAPPEARLGNRKPVQEAFREPNNGNDAALSLSATSTETSGSASSEFGLSDLDFDANNLTLTGTVKPRDERDRRAKKRERRQRNNNADSDDAQPPPRPDSPEYPAWCERQRNAQRLAEDSQRAAERLQPAEKPSGDNNSDAISTVAPSPAGSGGADIFVHVYLLLKFGLRESLTEYVPADVLNYIMEVYYYLHDGHFQDIKCGSFHSMAALTDGGLYGWGCNRYGQLGITNSQTQWQQNAQIDLKSFSFSDPQKIAVIGRFRSVACGDSHTLILTSKGVFACGNNVYGQLGLGRFDDDQTAKVNAPPVPVKLLNTTEPVYVDSQSSPEASVTAICCGHNHSLAKSRAGLFAWGRNHQGQLGLGDYDNRCEPTHVRLPPTGSDVDGAREEFYHVISMSAGACHTVVLTSVGLFGWGRNAQGQLGLGAELTKAVRPLALSLFLPQSCTPESLHVVKCGAASTMLLSRNGLDLYCAGENSRGQLGLGDDENRYNFCRVDLSAYGRILFFTLGSYFSLIVTSLGLFGCGQNDYGQLSEQKTLVKSVVFRSVNDGLGGRFRFLGCGYHHALAVSESQSFGWGRNDYGQLGFHPVGPLDFVTWKPEESPILSRIAAQLEEEQAKRGQVKVRLGAGRLG